MGQEFHGPRSFVTEEMTGDVQRALIISRSNFYTNEFDMGDNLRNNVRND
jgi:hypothetical protein